MEKKATWAVCLVLVLGSFTWAVLAQDEEPTFVIPENLPELKAPIIVTTCGQSPGALMVKLICDQVGIDCVEADLLTADEMTAECSDFEDVRDFAGVLFVTTGTSLKGMGAAGVDVDSEVSRCLALIDAAKELGMVIIVGQVEGPSRRVDEYDEDSIRAMSPLADLLITRDDVNEDEYFTTLAEQNGIPQIFISDTIDLQILLPLLFQEETSEETEEASGGEDG